MIPDKPKGQLGHPKGLHSFAGQGHLTGDAKAPTGDRALAQVVYDIYVVTVPRVGGDVPTINVANPDPEITYYDAKDARADVIRANVLVDGEVYGPASTTYLQMGTAIPTPSVKIGLTHDVYLTLSPQRTPQVTDEVVYLSAMEEQKHTVAQASADLDDKGEDMLFRLSRHAAPIAACRQRFKLC